MVGSGRYVNPTGHGDHALLLGGWGHVRERDAIYWIQAEPRRDPSEPRLRLTVCDGGQVTAEWPLGQYQPHDAWLERLTTDVPVGT